MRDHSIPDENQDWSVNVTQRGTRRKCVSFFYNFFFIYIWENWL